MFSEIDIKCTQTLRQTSLECLIMLVKFRLLRGWSCCLTQACSLCFLSSYKTKQMKSWRYYTFSSPRNKVTRIGSDKTSCSFSLLAAVPQLVTHFSALLKISPTGKTSWAYFSSTNHHYYAHCQQLFSSAFFSFNCRKDEPQPVSKTKSSPWDFACTWWSNNLFGVTGRIFLDRDRDTSRGVQALLTGIYKQCHILDKHIANM